MASSKLDRPKNYSPQSKQAKTPSAKKNKSQAHSEPAVQQHNASPPVAVNAKQNLNKAAHSQDKAPPQQDSPQ